MRHNLLKNELNWEFLPNWHLQKSFSKDIRTPDVRPHIALTGCPRGDGVGIMVRLLGLLIFFGGENLLWGQLVWNEKEIALNAEPEAQQTAVEFRFVNQGKKPVRLLQAKASCHCAVPQFEPRVYASGESGSVKVVFDHGMRRGLQKNTIVVKTDDPQGSDAVLMLKVELPQGLRTQPPFVLWKQGAKAETKELVLSIPEAQIISVESSNPEFRVKKEPKKIGITPVSTAKPVRAALRIQAKLPDGTQQSCTAYAVIK
jgi:hypothetical protein